MSRSARSARVTCMTGVEGAASGAGAFVGDATEAQTPAKVQSATGMPHGPSPGSPLRGPRARVASWPDGTAAAVWGRSASTDSAVGPQQSIGRVAASADAAEPSSICSASREASRARQPLCRSSGGRPRRERLNMEGIYAAVKAWFQIVNAIASCVPPAAGAAGKGPYVPGERLGTCTPTTRRRYRSCSGVASFGSGRHDPGTRIPHNIPRT